MIQKLNSSVILIDIAFWIADDIDKLELNSILLPL